MTGFSLMRLVVGLSTCVLLACNQRVKTSYAENDSVVIEGPVNGRGEYHGLVRYYTRKDGVLLSAYSYMNGKMDGEGVLFFRDGSVKSRLLYKQGLLHGFSDFYMAKGNTRLRKHYFHGLSVGPVIEFRNDTAWDYSFIDLEGQEIFHVPYDSLVGRKIADIEQHLFLYGTRPVSKYENDDSLRQTRLCFLYLPSPPKYQFHYTLIYTNSRFTPISVVDSLTSDLPWIEFEIPPNQDSLHVPALMLDVYDSTNRIWMKAFRRLN